MILIKNESNILTHNAAEHKLLLKETGVILYAKFSYEKKELDEEIPTLLHLQMTSHKKRSNRKS